MDQVLRSYPEYKKADLPWLAEIPAHWDRLKFKYLFTERVEKGFPNETLLAATQTKGVVPKDQYENRTVVAQKDLHLLKLVEQGDYVISLRSFQGGIEYAHYRGIISPAYTILKPSKLTKREYFEYFFKSAVFVESLSLFVTGIREGQNIDYDRLSRAPIPVPPVEEQVAIGQFLRILVTETNRYIRARRRQIELINEQKQAIIHQAVTRGLDPNGRLKPSGNDWLGYIPSHWKVVRLRNLVSRVTSGSRGWSSYAADDGPLFLRIANLTRNSIKIKLENVIRLNLPSTSEVQRTRVESGNLLLSITAYIGSVAVVPENFPEAYVSQHLALCRQRNNEQNPHYLAYFLLSPTGQIHGKISLYGGTKDGLSLDDVKNYPILLPPRQEQDEIVKYIDNRFEELDIIQDGIQHEINLIREYSTRLIADVVTGKLDVRGVDLSAFAETPSMESLDTELMLLEEEIAEDEETELIEETVDADD